MESAQTSSQPALDAIKGSDHFVVQQILKPIANEYRISVQSPGSTEEGDPVLFVKQKKMKIKEDIRFRSALDDDGHVFMIKSKTVFEFRGRHNVLDAQDNVIGTLSKGFAKSLLRSHWTVSDAEGTTLFEASESSLVVALTRRLSNASDYLFFLRWLPFNFTLTRDGDEVASYKRVLGKLRDRYTLEIGPGLEGVDRRLIIAFATALDALQDR
jgi:uncharacterized protein YxjI